MITVEEAESIILGQLRDYGIEIIPFTLALGRVLAEDIKADRDWPPFNRVSMDGIAINYQAIQNGCKAFKIKAVQAAGDVPVEIGDPEECIEIMTGAALSLSADTVVRYEDLEIKDGSASLINTTIKKGQNIHYQGTDKKQFDIIATAGQLVTPAIISLLASVGEIEIRVKRLPRIVILSSGDELVEVDETPSAYQIRRSNSYTIKAVLKKNDLQADILHLPDNPEIITEQLQNCLQDYDVLLLSGGISMGKFDHLPIAFEQLQVKKLIYKVKQRPGKPFWFGAHDNGAVAFAFPGNPVATFMCLHRYFLPWLQTTLGLPEKPAVYGVLSRDIIFQPPLKYFLQVKLRVNDQARIVADPREGNGSGDFANLADTDAFMELPSEKNEFKMGEVFKVWPFN